MIPAPTEQEPPGEVAAKTPAPVDSDASVRPPLSMLIACVLLLVCFGRTLLDLVRFAWNSNVYSHILLMPFITGYLLFRTRTVWTFSRKARFWPAAAPFLTGALLAMGYISSANSGWIASAEDRLALLSLSAVCYFWSIAAAYLPAGELRRAAFPLALLVFLAPFPTAVLNGIEVFLQRQSAEVANLLFLVSGLPYLRDDLVFQLPGITLQVAPECSGVRSTLALFITSLVGGYILLRAPLRRGILAAAVVPLALLRNGFRIFVIGQLCVQIGPEMIHSPIHHHGGPLFFALSLIPFLLLLLWLKFSERRHHPDAEGQGSELEGAASAGKERAE